jgi:hypothetical protein
MTRYVLCSNLECSCPLKEGQDFCDNCNAPSSSFLFPDSISAEGSLIGHVKDGSEYRLQPSFQSYAFYGITGSGKTSLARKVAIAAEIRGIKLLILDPEGEWKNIIPELRQHMDYYATTKNLKINPFDLKDKQLIRILLKETVLKGIQTEFWDLSPQMNYVLDMCIDRSNSIPELIDNVSYFQSDDLPFNLVGLERTKTALLVRLLPYKNNDVLKEIFYCDRSSVDLSKLDDRNIIFDLHELDAQVAYGNEVRLLYNVITIAALRQALSRDVSDRIEHLLVADEAQMLVPKILQKILVTDTWASTTYSTRGRKRSQAIMFCSQSPSNLEDDIRKNVAVNFIFRLQSPDDVQVAAGLLGYTHYARVDHISQVINTLKPRQTIVKEAGDRPVLIDAVDFTLPRMSDYLLSHFMPKPPNDFSGMEGEFLGSLESHPFISMLERRSLLGWDEKTYSQVVERLIGKGIVEKVRVPLGRGAPRVLYQRKGQVPSIKHEFYVHWLVTKLASKGLTCRAEKVGPDIQIPSLKAAINVECGKSNIHGNIPKALEHFERVVVCSDDKKVIENVFRQNQAANILCALVEDVPALFD